MQTQIARSRPNHQQLNELEYLVTKKPFFKRFRDLHNDLEHFQNVARKKTHQTFENTPLLDAELKRDTISAVYRDGAASPEYHPP